MGPEQVQPAPEDWRLRGYLSFKLDEVIDRLVNSMGWGMLALQALIGGGFAYFIFAKR